MPARRGAKSRRPARGRSVPSPAGWPTCRPGRCDRAGDRRRASGRRRRRSRAARRPRPGGGRDRRAGCRQRRAVDGIGPPSGQDVTTRPDDAPGGRTADPREWAVDGASGSTSGIGAFGSSRSSPLRDAATAGAPPASAAGGARRPTRPVSGSEPGSPQERGADRRRGGGSGRRGGAPPGQLQPSARRTPATGEAEHGGGHAAQRAEADSILPTSWRRAAARTAIAGPPRTRLVHPPGHPDGVAAIGPDIRRHRRCSSAGVEHPGHPGLVRPAGARREAGRRRTARARRGRGREPPPGASALGGAGDAAAGGGDRLEPGGADRLAADSHAP